MVIPVTVMFKLTNALCFMTLCSVAENYGSLVKIQKSKAYCRFRNVLVCVNHVKLLPNIWIKSFADWDYVTTICF